MAYLPIVSRSTESFTPGVVYADMSEVTTQQGTLVAGTYAYLQVLGRITASGKLTAHNPGASDGSQGAGGPRRLPGGRRRRRRGRGHPPARSP